MTKKKHKYFSSLSENTTKLMQESLKNKNDKKKLKSFERNCINILKLFYQLIELMKSS